MGNPKSRDIRSDFLIFPSKSSVRFLGATTHEQPSNAAARLARGLVWGMLALALMSGPEAKGQTQTIEGTPPGFIENGIPPFVVLGPESLGLNSAPVDIQQMPDGRILALGSRELVLGDGVRWEAFHEVRSDPANSATSLAVDNEGRMYMGVSGGFGRVDFTSDGQWKLTRIKSNPSNLGNSGGTFTRVTMLRNQWYWTWGSGPIVTWRPGTEPKMVGRLNVPEHVFGLGDGVYSSDGSNGALYRLENGSFVATSLGVDRYNAAQGAEAGMAQRLWRRVGGDVLVQFDRLVSSPITTSNCISKEFTTRDVLLFRTRRAAGIRNFKSLAAKSSKMTSRASPCRITSHAKGKTLT